MSRFSIGQDSKVLATQPKSAFTLVELLVVVSIIAILAAITVPAVQMARAAARNATCQNNLRQFGVGLNAKSTSHGKFCSGSFDWLRDGSVVDHSWVADLVKGGVNPGQLLCPSNTARVSEAYSDLLAYDSSSAPTLCGGIDLEGLPPTVAPDGTTLPNPCDAIFDGLAVTGSPNSPERAAWLEEYLFDRGFNTNYTASWYLARTGLRMTPSGTIGTSGYTLTPEPISSDSGCTFDFKSKNVTLGPLTAAAFDRSSFSISMVPLLADGGSVGMLSTSIGEVLAGTPLASSMSAGPNLSTGSHTWSEWANSRQDYRNFGVVHNGSCNVLFADGSVKAFRDEDNDEILGATETPNSQIAALYSILDKSAFAVETD